MKETLRVLARKDGRYAPEAFGFLSEALDYAVRLAGKDTAKGAERHISGQEVLAGLKACAREQFGPLAAHVWRAWGIRDTIDWGNIVFLLVDEGLLRRQSEDTIDDFRPSFDFDREFVEDYRPELPKRIE
jgi:uncharacterized repeat protein (TIGR04138 family)